MFRRCSHNFRLLAGFYLRASAACAQSLRCQQQQQRRHWAIADGNVGAPLAIT